MRGVRLCSRLKEGDRPQGCARFHLLLLVPLAVIFTTPLLWLVSTALKPDAQMAQWPPVWIPNPPQWENFHMCSQKAISVVPQEYTDHRVTGYARQRVDRFPMAAFGFCRLRFPGRNFLFGVLLATMMLPGVVTLIPTFILFRTLGWLNSYRAADRARLLRGRCAFFIFLLRQSFHGHSSRTV